MMPAHTQRPKPMGENIPTIRMHLWLETKEGLFFGMGRAMLLAKIAEHGSIKKAADVLGMSYQTAWGKIKKSEQVLGTKLIVQSGSKREGHALTESGKMLMEQFLLWFDEVEKGSTHESCSYIPLASSKLS